MAVGEQTVWEGGGENQPENLKQIISFFSHRISVISKKKVFIFRFSRITSKRGKGRLLPAPTLFPSPTPMNKVMA